MSSSHPPLLSPRFEDALTYAAHLHAGQRRKGSEVPYVAHLLSVAALVLEDGGSEYEAIAALLHDAPEDLDGQETLDDIRARFGDQVADIVRDCSDALEHPKPPWRQRKEAYLERLRTAGPEVCRVVLADKLHNARSILHDLKVQGNDTWRKFKGGKDGTLWYLHAASDILARNYQSPMLDELESVIGEIETLSAL